MHLLPCPGLLLHIPKTGGTWLGDVIRLNWRLTAHWRLRKLRHKDSLDLLDARFGADAPFGFAFRDPVERLHSAFDSRRNFSQPVRHVPWKPAEARCFGVFATFDAFARAFDGSDPAAQAEAEAALAGVPHFLHGLGFYFGTADRLMAAAPRIRFCAETRNLRPLLPALGPAFGLPPLHEPPQARRHTSEAVRTPLTDAGRATLRARLAGEYAIYDACRDLQARLHGGALAGISG